LISKTLEVRYTVWVGQDLWQNIFKDRQSWYCSLLLSTRIWR